MKKLFPGYYRPTEIEFAFLWDNCIFVLDANVLLNLYRYSAATSAELIDIINKISDRLWVPFQVASEYQSRRLDVIYKQKEAYAEIENLLIKSQNQLKGNLNNFLKHPLINVNSFIGQINNLFSNIIGELKQRESGHPDLIKEDKLRDRITTLFDGKVGFPYKDERKKEIYLHGEKRYENQIPPGFADANTKEGDEKYGDLILWFQMMDKAKDVQKPIIFITDDSKEDWWWIFKGKTIGPRPDLIEEFLSNCGQALYMYSSDQFMEYARQYLKQHVEQDAIDEIKAVKKQYDKFIWRHKMLKRKLYNNSLQIRQLYSEREMKRSEIEEIEHEISLVKRKLEKMDIFKLEGRDYVREELDELEHKLSGYIDQDRKVSVMINAMKEREKLINNKINLLENELKIYPESKSYDQ